MAAAEKEPAVRTIEYAGTHEVTIELAAWRNQSVVFGPHGNDRLRGQWNKRNLISDEHVEDLDGLPEQPLPGMRITVNMKERTAKIWDPIELPVFSELYAKLKAFFRDRFHRDLVPQKTVKKEKMSDTDIKTWLFEMRKLLDHPEHEDGQGRKVGGPLAVLVEGKLASAEEILLLPGQTKTEHFNTSTEMLKTREGKEKARESSQR